MANSGGHFFAYLPWPLAQIWPHRGHQEYISNRLQLHAGLLRAKGHIHF